MNLICTHIVVTFDPHYSFFHHSLADYTLAQNRKGLILMFLYIIIRNKRNCNLIMKTNGLTSAVPLITWRKITSALVLSDWQLSGVCTIVG